MSRKLSPAEVVEGLRKILKSRDAIDAILEELEAASSKEDAIDIMHSLQLDINIITNEIRNKCSEKSL